jgi:sialate O-acetylesterase|uniref:sialate O-acetylesterase n=1 Tax=Prosthecobacter sp. TaxID=1965333 RepID=UPI003784CBDA
MVLPAGRPVPLNGTAEPGTELTVEFGTQKKGATADKDGKWRITLDPMPASLESRVLRIHALLADAEALLQDVVVGDLWLCAGQSNMNFPLKASVEKQEALEAISTVDVRYFDGQSWMKLTRDNVSGLSAVGVWFAMEMARRQNAPVGFLKIGMGGTGIEAWIPERAFPDSEHGRRMRPLVNDPQVLKAAEEDAADPKVYGQHRLAKWGLARAVPASLYRKLVEPTADLPVRGAVWYQGESNAVPDAPHGEYRLWLKSLVASWRDLLHSPDLPFIVIQLPDYDPGMEENRAAWTRVQNEQAAAAQETDGVWVVETKGLGDPTNIHPKRKKEVGIRAAAAACQHLHLDGANAK